MNIQTVPLISFGSQAGKELEKVNKEFLENYSQKPAERKNLTEKLSNQVDSFVKNTNMDTEDRTASYNVLKAIISNLNVDSNRALNLSEIGSKVAQKLRSTAINQRIVTSDNPYEIKTTKSN